MPPRLGPAPGLPSLPLIGLFLLVSGVLAVQARQPLWILHLQGDIGEYWIRSEKYLAGTLEGTEYPPCAVLFFLLVRMLSLACHVGFADVLFFANHALLGLHLAFLNQVGGRLSALLFAALMLAAGPIVLFRYELLVSFLGLLAWHAWQRGRPAGAGALLGAAILSKLYPLVLLPLFLRPRRAEDERRRHAVRLAAGLAAGLGGVLLVFALGGGPLTMWSGLLSFHGSKPVALESTPAVIAMGVDVLRGAWPSHAVNEYGIHGLRFAGWVGRLVQLALVASLVGLLALYYRRRAELVPVATALLYAVVFGSTLYQPQYQLWPLTFLALWPSVGASTQRVVSLGALAVLALASEQIVYPTHYSEFLAAFYEARPGAWLLAAVVVSKLAIGALFALSVRESIASPAR